MSFFVDDARPDCALPIPGKGLTLLNLNEGCSRSVVPGERITGLTFEPLCMVVVIAKLGKQLFDEMLAPDGRSSRSCAWSGTTRLA